MEENKDIIDEVNIEEENYKVNISDEVVATIAGIAAAEIEGVADMSGGVVGGIAERLGAKKSPQKGVKVDVTPDGAVIDLYIIVDFGVRIPELAWEIQENVKNSVETMTGIETKKINVHVEGVRFEKAAKKVPKKKEEVPCDTSDEPETMEESGISREIELDSIPEDE